MQSQLLKWNKLNNCFQVIYCDQTCQKTHWFAHKKICKNLKDIYEKQQLEAAKEKSEEENSTYIKSKLMEKRNDIININTGHQGMEYSLGTEETWSWPA